MKKLKIKVGLFSLLAILAFSVFLTSCEQELVTPQQEENLNIPLINKYSEITPNFNSIPAVNTVPEKTSENTASTNLSDRACLQYNNWNYFEQTGWIYVYEYPASWVWSDKYQDFIYMTNQTDICDYGLIFHTNNPICGKIGWMWDSDASDNTLWQHNNGWQAFNCGSVCDDNDFSSRFQNYITQYSYLEGTASCCGALNFANDLIDFRNLVQTNASLDIKNSDSFLKNLGANGCSVQFFGREVAVDVPGNVLYGFIGHLYWKNKYPDNSYSFLAAAAGLAQGISDEKLNDSPNTTGLLAFQDEWLCLTSYDPWCDTYAIRFGVYLAKTHGANITYQEFQNGMNWIGAYLHDASYSCKNNAGQNANSPTGLVDCSRP